MASKIQEFDVVIVGSGFGGSVAALRLTEKGYRVAVIEAGRRFEDKDFPCLLYTSPSPRDVEESRMPSSA